MGSWSIDYQNQSPMLGTASGPNMPRMRYIVKSIQIELNHNGANPLLTTDGVFGPLTAAAVVHFQKTHALVADGVVGPNTARSLCQLRCGAVEIQQGLPLKGILAGLIRTESAYDFGATGFVDTRDRGLAQINSGAHPDVADSDAFSSTYAITWAGRQLAFGFTHFSDDVECAIASYNLGTAGATTWCADKSSNPQALSYVHDVLKGP